MKILHLGKYFPPDYGGVERVTYVTANGAVEAGYDVTVIVFNSSQKYKREKIGGIKVIRLPRIVKIFRTPFTTPIVSLIKEIKPDLIHLHIPNPWFELNLLFYLILNPKTKIVATYHSDVINYTPIHFIGNLIRYIYIFPLLKLFCKRIMATSPNYVKGSFILSNVSEKVSVIPLGIDIPRYKTKEKIKSDKKNLLFVGRLFPYKGLEYLLYAVKIISDIRKDFILYVVGEGELRKKLEKEVKSLMIEDFVKFVGKLSDKEVLKYYNSCDIFILPSIFKSEAFGITQLETMAFGKPIISTNIDGSGVSYVNINSVTGITVEPKNSKALANAIIKLLDNEQLRLRMGRNGRERLKKYFDQDKMVKDILNVYKDVLKGN